MIAPELPPSDFYRLEQMATGERLVPVQRMDEATHTSIDLLRRVMEARTRDVVGLHAEIDQLRQRLQEQESGLTQQHELLAQTQDAVRRLLQKNSDLISEKRRLRDALSGKRPLPSVAYRIDVDRDGVARESNVVTLDAFPHRERVREALAEARRRAARHNGHLRQVRLDTSAWRAVIQRVIEA